MSAIKQNRANQKVNSQRKSRDDQVEDVIFGDETHQDIAARFAQENFMLRRLVVKLSLEKFELD
jgi:hypothetical protein